jgi:hypothetical protein
MILSKLDESVETSYRQEQYRHTNHDLTITPSKILDYTPYQH